MRAASLFSPKRQRCLSTAEAGATGSLASGIGDGMSHNLASGIISAAVLPFDDSGAIDWKTLERYIIQVAAGDPRAIAMNMAVSEVSSLEVPEQLEVIRRCKATLGRRVHAAVRAQRHAHRRRGRSRQAPGRCGRRGPGDLPAGAGVPQRAVGRDDRRLPQRRGRGGEGAAARLPDQLLQLSEGHDQRAVADPRASSRSRTRRSTSSRRSTTSRKPTARSARSAC